MASMEPQDEQKTLRLALAVCLTGIAGYVDAVAFVRLGGAFVSFMSGNSTRLAALPALGRTGGALLSLGLVALFVMGAFAGRLIEAATGVWRRPAVMSTVSVLLLLASMAALFRSPAALALGTAAMTLAMGAQNTVLRRVGKARATATYVTGVLVHLGHELANAAMGERSVWGVYLLMWLGLVLGAALGAVAVLRFGAVCLIAPAALSALLALSLGGLVRRANPGCPS